MTDQAYEDLAGVLDRLPGGFPRTETRVEIAILQRLFEPEEAGLAVHLAAYAETVGAIAGRATIEEPGTAAVSTQQPHMSHFLATIT